MSHLSDPHLYWEAGKAFLRGRIISYAAGFRRTAALNFKHASDSLREAQCSLLLNDSITTRKVRLDAKARFNT